MQRYSETRRIVKLVHPLRVAHGQDIIRMKKGPEATVQVYAEWAHGAWLGLAQEILNMTQDSEALEFCLLDTAWPEQATNEEARVYSQSPCSE
jgi:hypothetical protein